MAGIGFELRKMLKKESLLSMGKMYVYAGLLSAGPWVISIVAILLVGFINISLTQGPVIHTIQFQIIITYAIALASSLIVTGVIQLPYTRYIADLIFYHKEEKILPSFFGTLFITWLVALPLVWFAVWYAFPEQNWIFRLEAASVFLVLCGVWIANVLATSLKYYKGVVFAYFVSYGLIVLASYWIRIDIDNLLIIFVAGNVLLLGILVGLIIKQYHAGRFMHFDFFNRKKFYWKLAWAGLFYNAGVWIDKFIFWYHPLTGHAVIGKVHASIVYDLPIFIAYLSIIPGMAIFFYRLEADFADKYAKYYDAVLKNGTLETIEYYRHEMGMSIRQALREILVYQGIIDIIIFLLAPYVFSVLKIPQLYLGLFYILTVGATLQLGFMSVLAFLFYLDRRGEAMWLAFGFLVLNALLTISTIYMGPSWFGYGYSVSLLVVFVAALIVINHVMENLDYETFMLR